MVIIFYVIIAPKIYSLSKFSVFNTVLLTVVIMLYIGSLNLIIRHNCSIVPLTYLPTSLTFPFPCLPTTAYLTLCVRVFDFSMFHM